MDSVSDQNILVIDDEAEIRQLLSEALISQGFQVDQAETGEQGLEKFKSGKYSLILTDLMMPGMSGLDVLEEIKKIDSLVEVVLLTGYGSHDTALDAMRKGAYDYLEKPMDLLELVLIVRKALERRKLMLENQLYQKNLEKLVKHRTKQLESTKNFLKLVLDSSMDYSIIATNRDGIITLFNHGSERLLGYSAEEVEGKETVLLFTPEDQKGTGTLNQFFGLDIGQSEKDVQREREKVVQNKNGKKIIISLDVSKMTNSRDEVIGYLGIAKDITRRKRLELKLKKYTEGLEELVDQRTVQLKNRNIELEETLNKLNETQSQLVQSEKMASLGQLAAGVAHEINNPVGFLSSNLGVMRKYTGRLEEMLKFFKEESEKNNETKEIFEEKWKKLKIDKILADLVNVLGESRDGVDRVKNIVQDMKNFSRLDNAERLKGDIISGIESTLNIVRNEIKYKADVKKQYDEIPDVYCNLQQINQVFLNILVNAAQAIENPPGEIFIHVHKLNEDFISIDIQDNGKGIEKGSIDRLFDPFYTTKPVGEGTGLGLSVSYKIIKEHGGEIKVDSTPGEGTKFMIVLPVKQKNIKVSESNG